MDRKVFQARIKGRFKVVTKELVKVGCEADPFKIPAKYCLKFKPVTGEAGVTHRAQFGEFEIEIDVKKRNDKKFLLEKCEFK